MSDHHLDTVDRARGRWREILPRLGIETRFLQNKHGPCPLCGGRDRYRFDDKDGSGSYYCSQCGAGVGIILVRKRNGWDFKTACDRIDEIIGTAGDDFCRQPTAEKSNADKASRDVAQLLSEANDPGVVAAYLAKRGLGVSSPILRGHAACPYYNEGRQYVGRFPAVVAPITAPDDKLESAQRIYDANIEPRKKAMPPVRTLNGAAVRLHKADEVLGVSEGIETALAAHEMFRIPVWAALTANGLKTFQAPATVKRLVIFGDNDASFVGQTAAYQLAERIRKAGLTVEVRIPPNPDTDWLDELNAMNGRAAA